MIIDFKRKARNRTLVKEIMKMRFQLHIVPDKMGSFENIGDS